MSVKKAKVAFRRRWYHLRQHYATVADLLSVNTSAGIPSIAHVGNCCQHDDFFLQRCLLCVRNIVVNMQEGT